MERVISKNGVVFYRSRLIPVRHGFSTRIGGVSTEMHTASLNLGVERGDPLDTVLENLSLFGEALDVDPKDIISLPQIHSNKVKAVTKSNAGEGFYLPPTDSCDGYITTDKDIALGVRTADCVPILMYAPPKGEFCGSVMAVHAGWRGTASGIAVNAVKKALELGACASEIKAAIGPAIGSCCYEVKDDFFESFKESAGKTLTERFVVPSKKQKDSFYADLKGANKALLMSVGLKEENIDICDACTCCDPKEFYSHRYTGGLRGTMLSIIML